MSATYKRTVLADVLAEVSMQEGWEESLVDPDDAFLMIEWGRYGNWATSAQDVDALLAAHANQEYRGDWMDDDPTIIDLATGEVLAVEYRLVAEPTGLNYREVL